MSSILSFSGIFQNFQDPNFSLVPITRYAFIPNAPFLYPPPQGVEKVCIGNKWVKTRYLDILHNFVALLYRFMQK